MGSTVLRFFGSSVVIYTGITGYQACIARDTARRQLRAYIGVGDPHFGEKFPSEVEVVVSNGGQTPAYNLKARLNRKWVSVGQGFPTDFGYPDLGSDAGPTSVAYVNPGKERTFTFPIDNNELNQARDGKTDLFIYGHVDYEDIYQQKRSTTFLYQYKGSNGSKGEVVHRLILLDQHNKAN